MSEDTYEEGIDSRTRLDQGEMIDPGLAQWLLDPQKALHRLSERFRGKRWDPAKGTFEKIRGAKPLMGERGIQLFIDTALGTMSETLVTISNFDDRTESNISRDVMRGITTMLWTDYDVFGIDTDEKGHPDLAVLSSIKIATNPFVRGVMRQAFNEGIRNFLKKWSRVLETRGDKRGWGVGR